jgi:hypothetical protein
VLVVDVGPDWEDEVVDDVEVVDVGGSDVETGVEVDVDVGGAPVAVEVEEVDVVGTSGPVDVDVVLTVAVVDEEDAEPGGEEDVLVEDVLVDDDVLADEEVLLEVDEVDDEVLVDVAPPPAGTAVVHAPLPATPS